MILKDKFLKSLLTYSIVKSNFLCHLGEIEILYAGYVHSYYRSDTNLTRPNLGHFSRGTLAYLKKTFIKS